MYTSAGPNGTLSTYSIDLHHDMSVMRIHKIANRVVTG